MESITTNSSLKKYTNIIKRMVTHECNLAEAIEDLTVKEAELISHIHEFIVILYQQTFQTGTKGKNVIQNDPPIYRCLHL
jgi:hypothetical protein